jgi:hypothetical protein
MDKAKDLVDALFKQQGLPDEAFMAMVQGGVVLTTFRDGSFHYEAIDPHRLFIDSGKDTVLSEGE